MVNPLDLSKVWTKAAGMAASSTRVAIRGPPPLNVSSVPQNQGLAFRENITRDVSSGQTRTVKVNDRMEGNRYKGPLGLDRNAGVSKGTAAGSSGQSTSGGGHIGGRFEVMN